MKNRGARPPSPSLRQPARGCSNVSRTAAARSWFERICTARRKAIDITSILVTTAGAAGPSRQREYAHGSGNAHHQQQELRLLVAARLVAVQNRRHRVRGADALERR